MSHTSSAPTSALDGDDPCGIDVTEVAIDTITLLVCLCGLVGNGAVFWLLNRFISDRNTFTVYIFRLVITDLRFLLLMFISSLLSIAEYISCPIVLLLRYVMLFSDLALLYYNVELYFLTCISIEKSLSILCPTWYRSHCNKHLSVLVCEVHWFFSYAVYFTAYSLCLSGEHKPCRVSLISMYALNLFIFVPPMVISNMILFINIKRESQKKQSRRLHIVIFLIVLFFLLFGLPLSLQNFLQQFTYNIMPTQVAFLLACIQSSIKPFIYFLVGGCWRQCSLVSLQVSFLRVFEEPEENTASSNDVSMEMGVPPTVLLKDPGTVGEGFLESPDE